MVNPSTESILNQMTNLAMDIAMDYVLPASPMSDVCKSDLQEFEREVYAAVSGCGAGAPAGGLLSNLVAGTAGTAGGCCGRPPTDLCKKNSYMGAAGCDSCEACLARRAAAAGERLSSAGGNKTGVAYSAYGGSRYGGSSSLSPSSTASSPSSSTSPSSMLSPTGSACASMPTPPQQQTAETTMDISWCQFDGCEFDTADNSYLDICDWIFYADRYALTEENREKVQKAFQMVPPGEVTGYVAQPPVVAAAAAPAKKDAVSSPGITVASAAVGRSSVASTVGGTAMTGAGGVTIKCEPDDDYLWTSDHHLQPIILKAEPDADILQITELDHSYLQSGSGGGGSASSSAAVSPAKHHLTSHNHLVDMLGLVTPPPSRSQSSEEEEIDVVNDSWDTPDTPRKGATMADIMKRGIVKKREPPVTKWKNTVKRKHHHGSSKAAGYPMPPPPPKKLCGAGGLSLLDRFKKDAARAVIKTEPVVKSEPEPEPTYVIKPEPIDEDDEDADLDDTTAALLLETASSANAADDERLLRVATVKADLLQEEEEDEDYDMDADFESLMKNEPDDMFDDEYDDYDDDNDLDWDKVMRGSAAASADASSASGGGRSHKSSSGASSSCSSSGGRGGGNCSSSGSSTAAGPGRKKKKKKTKTKGSSSAKSAKQHHGHHHHMSGSSGKKIKYEGGSGQYSYKTKLMDPVKRALHNDLEKSRRVETSMLFMNLSMQVSFLDDNRKIPSKLSILRGAKRECDLMMLDERRLLSEKHVMQQKQRMLRERLFELRREQFHRRYGKSSAGNKQLSQH